VQLALARRHEKELDLFHGRSRLSRVFRVLGCCEANDRLTGKGYLVITELMNTFIRTRNRWPLAEPSRLAMTFFTHAFTKRADFKAHSYGRARPSAVTDLCSHVSTGSCIGLTKSTESAPQEALIANEIV